MSEPAPYPVPLNCALPVAATMQPPPLPAEETRPPAGLPVSTTFYPPITRIHTVDADEPSWFKTVKTKVNEVKQKSSSAGPCTIFKFPDFLRRRVDTKAYGPLVASVGPFHYFPSQRGTALTMQDHKWRCVRHLLSRHRSRAHADELLERCLLELKALDAKVRSCYSENFRHLDPHKLASVMLMDGCFILHLLLKQVSPASPPTKEKKEVEEVKEVKEMKETKENKKEEEEEDKVVLDIGEKEEEVEGPLLGMLWIWDLVLYDLLKFENQIPFFVIRALFNILKTPAEEGVDIVELVLRLFSNIHPFKADTPAPPKPADRVHHLLHLFHSTLVPSQISVPAETLTVPKWIPSAVELQKSGLKFAKSNDSCFLNVSFKRGTMRIPQLRLDEHTGLLLRNLVAFEQCFPDAEGYVSGYAGFMRCIVRSKEDVRLLTAEGVLDNRMNSDEAAVLELFNEICGQMMVSYKIEKSYLRGVFADVKKYSETRWCKWRGRN